MHAHNFSWIKLEASGMGIKKVSAASHSAQQYLGVEVPGKQGII